MADAVRRALPIKAQPANTAAHYSALSALQSVVSPPFAVLFAGCCCVVLDPIGGRGRTGPLADRSAVQRRGGRHAQSNTPQWCTAQRNDRCSARTPMEPQHREREEKEKQRKKDAKANESIATQRSHRSTHFKLYLSRFGSFFNRDERFNSTRPAKT
jgi:hypothetical protein